MEQPVGDRESIQDKVLDESDGVDDGFLGFSVLAADAGKGVAELLTDQNMKPAELKRFRTQGRIELGTGRLSPEFQSRTQDLDNVGYLENLGEDATVPVTCMQRDTSFLRISNNLNNLSMVRGDISGSSRSELSRSLEANGIKFEMSSNIDNVHLPNLRPNKWVKSGRLSVINSIILFVFNDSNCAKEPIYCMEKRKNDECSGLQLP